MESNYWNNRGKTVMNTPLKKEQETKYSKSKWGWRILLPDFQKNCKTRSYNQHLSTQNKEQINNFITKVSQYCVLELWMISRVVCLTKAFKNLRYLTELLACKNLREIRKSQIMNRTNQGLGENKNLYEYTILLSFAS